MPYQCDSGDGNAPVVAIQMLTGDAESLAWCGDCLPLWIMTMYDGMGLAELRQQMQDQADSIALAEDQDVADLASTDQAGEADAPALAPHPDQDLGAGVTTDDLPAASPAAAG